MSGVVVARNASNRLSAAPAPSTCHAGTFSAKPFRVTVPRSRYSNRPPVSLSCACCDHNGARLGQRLEASSKVGRLADHRLLLGCSCTDQVADNNEPGGDADPNLQGRIGMRCELRNRLDQGKPGTNCALGIMFMRLWVAEIGENAVAHVFGDEAAIALDQFRAAAVIGGE